MIGLVTIPYCATAFTPAALDIVARPTYPDTAREQGAQGAQGAQGSSVVAVAIADTGAVLDVSLETSAGNASLDHAALVSAALSRFTHALCNRRAVTAVYRYLVRFRLDDRTGAATVTVGEPPWRGPYSEMPREKSRAPTGFAY